MHFLTLVRKTSLHGVLFFSFFFILLIVPSLLSAQGNLLITPRRVVFEGNKKTDELNLANTGTDTAKFVVSLVQYRMKQDGAMEEVFVPDSGQNFADKYLRFFPRNVVLAPNESQVVRVQLTRAGELKPGEYRSHIYFRAVPDEKPLGETSKDVDTSALVVKLTPIFGITIPVIIRVGNSDTKTELTAMSFAMHNDTLPVLSLTFNRTGNMSVYGDISVKYISPEGSEMQVGIVKGIAVYTPNSKRDFQMLLEKNPAISYRTGRLVVTYSAQGDSRSEVLAKEELILK